jgi:hypothetical protein
VLQCSSQLRLRRGVGDVANERGIGTPRHGLIVARAKGDNDAVVT